MQNETHFRGCGKPINKNGFVTKSKNAMQGIYKSIATLSAMTTLSSFKNFTDALPVQSKKMYTFGRDAAIIVRLARFLSDRMLDSLLARSLKPHLPKALPTT